jgi:hypothetical protein
MILLLAVSVIELVMLADIDEDVIESLEVCAFKDDVEDVVTADVSCCCTFLAVLV